MQSFDPSDSVPRVYPDNELYPFIYQYFGDSSPNGDAFWQAMALYPSPEFPYYTRFLALWTIEDFDDTGIEFDPENMMVDGRKVSSLNPEGESFVADIWISKDELNASLKRDIRLVKKDMRPSKEISGLLDRIRTNIVDYGTNYEDLRPWEALDSQVEFGL
jgi:hypothetical protein